MEGGAWGAFVVVLVCSVFLVLFFWCFFFFFFFFFLGGGGGGGGGVSRFWGLFWYGNGFLHVINEKAPCYRVHVTDPHCRHLRRKIKFGTKNHKLAKTSGEKNIA